MIDPYTISRSTIPAAIITSPSQAFVESGCRNTTLSINAVSRIPLPPQVHIILNGQQDPVCVIRITSLRLVRFCDVDEAFARKEGEGDLSLTYWRIEHQRFFTQAGSFSEEMELVAEEFEVVEVV